MVPLTKVEHTRARWMVKFVQKRNLPPPLPTIGHERVRSLYANSQSDSASFNDIEFHCILLLLYAVIVVFFFALITNHRKRHDLFSWVTNSSTKIQNSQNILWIFDHVTYQSCRTIIFHTLKVNIWIILLCEFCII